MTTLLNTELKMTNNTLKLCPFCGRGETEFITENGFPFYDKCNICGATGPEIYRYSGEEDTDYFSWNTRHTDKRILEVLKFYADENNYIGQKAAELYEELKGVEDGH